MEQPSVSFIINFVCKGLVIIFAYCTGDSDYSVVTGPSSLLTLSSTNQQTTTDVTIISDGIVLEGNETFSLQLQQTSGQQPVIALRNTTITILDGDGEFHTHYAYNQLPCHPYSANWRGLL